MKEYDGRMEALEVRIAQLEQMVMQSSGAEEEGELHEMATRPLDGQPGRAFEYGVEGTDCKFVNCKFQFGRRVYEIADQTANANGTYYLVIPHAAPENAAVMATNPGTDDTATCIPLITVVDGKITNDYRGMPVVPVYE